MKHKIPTDIFVHPDSGEQCLYDPATDSISTLGDDKVIQASHIEGRRQLERFREWAATVSGRRGQNDG